MSNEKTALQDARIESVKTRTVSIPLDNPTSFSTRKVCAREYTLVKIRTEDGHEGIGFCYAGSHGGTIVSHAVRELFRDRLVGQPAYRTEGVWQGVSQDKLLHGRGGAVLRGRSVVC